jgi:hypothetical protein
MSDLQEATAEDVSADPVEEVAETTTPEAESQQAQQLADKAAKALQRRIDRLTREKYELKAENDQLRTPKQQADDEKEHLTEDEVETRAEARAREIAEIKQIEKHCNEVFDEGLKENKEFAKAFRSLAEEIGAPFDKKGRPTPTMSAILDADKPHKLIQHLADNPDIAAELADLSPTKQIRRIVQIEKEMGEEAKPKQSSAPKPATPVSAAASGSKDPATMTDKEFAEWRKNDIKKRNGR